MSTINVSSGNLSSGLPETVLPDPPAAATAALVQARDGGVAAGVAEVLVHYPRLLEGWATLGEMALPGQGAGEGAITAYAYFRVGYHRGLDALRAAGWRGSGYVRWREPTNRGFLRCLDGLRETATRIGEDDEAERCQLFLHQLDPAWDRR